MKSPIQFQVQNQLYLIPFFFSALSHRPRKILLFVNPFGGKRKGLHIWEKQVEPLMQLAGLETKVLVTERAGHIRDTLLTCELDSYQVIVIFTFKYIYTCE